jgi:KipI family sensor histidine kinase inhibitor
VSSAGEPRRVLRGVADGSLLVQYPDASDEEANAAAVRLARALDTQPGGGILDLVPGARTLFVSYDPAIVSEDDVAYRIAAASLEEHAGQFPREHRIAVAYGGAAGPDLEEVARRAELSPEEAARRHAAAVYRVAFLGFAPGFAYLTGLPPELGAPRRPTPRPRVPGGTLAVAGEYSGIYPADGPGGWNLIGTAGAVLFDPRREPPVLFLPGDLVRFVALTEEEVRRLSRPHPDPLPPGEGVFRVVSPGLWSGIVGGPRPGSGRLGVPPGGAMDLDLLAEGNAALGNPADAPALEIALWGPELEALADCTAVLVGGRRAGYLRQGEPFSLSRGERLKVEEVIGARAYLCVVGGFAEAGPAGAPRRLMPGDVVVGDPGRAPAGRFPRPEPRFDTNNVLVRIVLGPQEDRFGEKGIATLLQSEYRVSPSSDRRGVRLEGPPLEHRGGPAGAEIPPEGTALGAIQVPADGLPIILGPDRPITGGYAKIGTVIGADFPLVAQAKPVSILRFQAVSVEEAVDARRRMNLP